MKQFLVSSYIHKDIEHVWKRQCDQIGRFLKVFGDLFST